MNTRFTTCEAGLPSGCARGSRKRRSNALQESEKREATLRNDTQVDNCGGVKVDDIVHSAVISQK